ncbi:hypothetical protein [Pseudorhodoferax sp.]|uniref:hypothetical protein n=1 Tax=Pseudorhodoferax sp. TaxID=1993553 RepID=UPI002DD61C4B|nr:hypothetical protein [Pseudorhodoferax sp.]
MKRLAAFAGLGLASQLAQAQILAGLAAPERALVDEPVRIEVQLQVTGSTVGCNLRIAFGDGSAAEHRVDRNPFVLTKRYAAAGHYTVEASGLLFVKGEWPSLPCLGTAKSAQLQVLDRKAAPLPLPPPPAAAAPVPAAPPPAASPPPPAVPPKPPAAAPASRPATPPKEAPKEAPRPAPRKPADDTLDIFK